MRFHEPFLQIWNTLSGLHDYTCPFDLCLHTSFLGELTTLSNSLFLHVQEAKISFLNSFPGTTVSTQRINQFFVLLYTLVKENLLPTLAPLKRLSSFHCSTCEQFSKGWPVLET